MVVVRSWLFVVHASMHGNHGAKVRTSRADGFKCLNAGTVFL